LIVVVRPLLARSWTPQQPPPLPLSGGEAASRDAGPTAVFDP